jgi:hypothetical protein
MNLTLIRDTLTETSTIGSLFIENEFECFVLEDEDRKLEAGGTKVYGKTAIPRGRYEITFDWSPKYGRDMPHLLNVPGFEGIRIHTGNRAEDSEGCLLPGTEKVENYVRNSKVAFDALLKKMTAAWSKDEEVWITIT